MHLFGFEEREIRELAYEHFQLDPVIKLPHCAVIDGASALAMTLHRLRGASLLSLSEIWGYGLSSVGTITNSMITTLNQACVVNT
jgi:hypothetical protein